MTSTSTASNIAATPPPAEATQQARLLVRLVQCSQCSRPLRYPIILPCGNSICRACIPESHQREHISYPNNLDRLRGILCPVQECQQEHPSLDCCVDVVLLKVMETITTELTRQRSLATNMPILHLQEVLDKNTADLVDGEKEKLSAHSGTYTGGRLIAMYTMAEQGELAYTSEAVCQSEHEADLDASDAALLEEIKEASQNHVECHVCYNIMLDPVTTPCGHTFCRNCLARTLDHSSQCAVCRRTLPLPASLSRQSSNIRLVNLLNNLCYTQITARAEAYAQEQAEIQTGLDTALFVCGLAFPSIPTFLHVFEPRYRLMIRRAQESTGHFGMLGYNVRGTPQGSLGRTPFYEYGTLLKIESIQYLPDGRSFILTRGVSRFRVLEHGLLDGYTVGRVEKIEDISLTEEEALEAAETSVEGTSSRGSTESSPSSPTPSSPTHLLAELDRMPTAGLLQICADFVDRAQASSAPWLHRNILDVYGEPPVEDPALFPYWFASVLPISEEEKLKLLPTTSVRQRLKITTRWIRRIEAQRWYHGSSCTLL